jgi:uncharacterized protein
MTIAGGALSLWHWRRSVSELYSAARRLPPEEGWRLWRETRDWLFAAHPQTPLGAATRDAFRGIEHFPYDPALRFEADLAPAEGGSVLIDAGPDGVIALTPFAVTRGLAAPLGSELTLYWIGGYGGGVFLPFRDATSGAETYGGGRYLLDTIKGADLGQAAGGEAILDFNFAYNPSCAYDARWLCPLAPPENRLPAAVRAGEKRFAG